MAPSERLPFAAAAGGVTVSVRVTPRASRSRVTGIAAEADGAPVLTVAVTAAPEGGRANAALVRLLAKEWRLAKSSITVASGAGSRRKTLQISGDSDRLLLDLGAWVSEMG